MVKYVAVAVAIWNFLEKKEYLAFNIQSILKSDYIFIQIKTILTYTEQKIPIENKETTSDNWISILCLLRQKTQLNRSTRSKRNGKTLKTNLAKHIDIN